MKKMKKEEEKQFIRCCNLGALGGILMAAGDWLLGCVPFQKTDTDLYDQMDVIPFEKLNSFFTEYLR